MSALQEILSWPAAQRSGWLVVSFVWQGTAVAAALALSLFALRRASANARYLAACAALVIMAACPLATCVWTAIHRSEAAPAQADHISLARGELDVAALTAPAVRQDLFVHENASDVGASSHVPAASAAPGGIAVDAEAPRFNQAPWISLLAAAWLGGVALLSIRLVLGGRHVSRLRRQASQTAAKELQAAMARLAEHFHITWPVRLVETARVEVPTVIGWIKPAILLPATAISGLSVEQLEALLAHELAHIRRHDYLVNLVQTAIETLLFYHPAVWWVSGCIRQEREHCCDDMAVTACGNRLAYARSLMTLEELRLTLHPWALAAGGGRLLPRIRRIVGAPSAAKCAAGYWLAGALLVLLSMSIIAEVTHSAQAAGDDQPKIEAKAPAAAQTTKAANGSDADQSQTPETSADVADKTGDTNKREESHVAVSSVTAPPIVEVSHPIAREVYDFEDFTGEVVPAQKVDLRARVSGQLELVRVKEGDLVKQGDALFMIDSQQYQAEVDKAMANLKLAEARFKRANTDLESAKHLVSSTPGAMSKQELDHLEAEHDETKAAMQSAQASAEIAMLNLSHTKIVAPINGRIGKIQIDAGNMVKADDTLLATLMSTDPMYIAFWMDQRNLVRLQAAERAGKFKFAGAPLRFHLGDAHGFPYKATLLSGAYEVQTNSGATLLRAVAPNNDGALLPGMFARVRLPTGGPHQALLVPSQAVYAGTGGQIYVDIVNGHNIVEQRAVKFGQNIIDGLTVINEGLTKDDWVANNFDPAGRGRLVEPKQVKTPVETKPALDEANPASK
jgi:RND family efflux transporter MFP subunit